MQSERQPVEDATIHDMSAPAGCPVCGSPLPSDAPRGLCPKCLLVRRSPERDPTTPNAQPSTKRIQRFGDYELLEEIARGGMGVVYKARQLSLNRTVAVKMILSGQLASDADVQRFRHEAEAAASLQQSNIVAIHEVGEHEGHHYFSMDFVAGRNLAELVRDGPLPAKRAAAYVRTISQAIQYAHDRGILHRDLKPSNILIDQNDQPRITDFGLAKRIVAPASSTASSADLASAPFDSDLGRARPDNLRAGTPALHALTVSGQVLGTPNFMPPEQASGRRHALGPASDVYSIGAVLYHLLTGRPPFVAETILETLQQVLGGDPPAPRQVNPAVPRDLETICLKCLEKNSARRYASAGELADDLQRWLMQKPIRARPVNALERVVKWVRRRPVTAGLCTAIFVSVVLGLIAVRQSHRATEQRRQTAEANVRRQLQTAEDHFAADNASLALAVLARALRDNPANRVAAERLVNTLCQRTFFIAALPEPRVALPDGSGGFLSAIHESPSAGVRSPDGLRELLGQGTNVITVLDISSGLIRLVIRDAHDRVIRSLAWSSDGQRIVSAAADNTARTWDARTGELLRLLPHPDAVYHAEFSSNGLRVVTACVDGKARVWNTMDGTKISEMSHRDVVNKARFSPDSRHVITASDDGTARLWNSDTGRAIGEPFRATRMGAAAESQVAAVEDAWFLSGAQVMVQLETGERLRCHLTPGLTLRVDSAGAGASPLPAAAVKMLSGDGALVATAFDKTVLVLDARSGQPLTPPLAHEAVVNCLAFSPDSRRLATSTAGRRVRLWDARSGHPLSDWIDSPLPVVSVGFSADNAALVTSARWRWSFHAAESSAPPWLAELAESVAGVRLNERQEPEPVAPLAVGQVLETIARTSVTEPLAAWANAFLTDEVQAHPK